MLFIHNPADGATVDPSHSMKLNIQALEAGICYYQYILCHFRIIAELGYKIVFLILNLSLLLLLLSDTASTQFQKSLLLRPNNVVVSEKRKIWGHNSIENYFFNVLSFLHVSNMYQIPLYV